MVTRQQQLAWLAKNLKEWKQGYEFAVVEKEAMGGGTLYVRWPSV